MNLTNDRFLFLQTKDKIAAFTRSAFLRNVLPPPPLSLSDIKYLIKIYGSLNKNDILFDLLNNLLCSYWTYYMMHTTQVYKNTK